ncbi:MAG: tyrosine-protein kinase family protein [Phycisphaerales bacterium]|nr:MAG: tyrosine-protein kinase family protein [Phycisphaerales bacterium]
MGRIADALKRAEMERRTALGHDADPFDAATALCQPPSKPAAAAAACAASITAEEPEEPVRLVEGLSEALVAYYAKSSLISEQYRSLRTRLLSQNPQGEHKVLAITSAIPKEGKSVTTLNLGCTLAEIRHLKVLVVDGDFRRSSLRSMLNLKNGPGLADVLAGAAQYEDVIQPTPIANLHFVPAGRTNGRSAAELLSARNCRQVFRLMQAQYHYTIVDTPPATTVTDAGIIGQMCNGVIVIVRLNHTHESSTKRAVRLLQSNNIPILGCLIIGRDRPFIGYGYGYGYGYNYYRYYDYYRKQQESPR